MPTTSNQESAMKEQGSLVGVGREPYWKELKTDQKIERMRVLLKSLVNENATLRRKINTLKEHVHDKDGKAIIVKELKNYYEDELQMSGNVLVQKDGEEYI